MTWIQIYMLTDTITNEPFYVGATRMVLESRYKMHIQWAKEQLCISKYDIIHARHEHMQWVIKEGGDIKIILIDVVPINDAKQKEKLYHDKLVSLQFKLLQCTDKFTYPKH